MNIPMPSAKLSDNEKLITWVRIERFSHRYTLQLTILSFQSEVTLSLAISLQVIATALIAYRICRYMRSAKKAYGSRTYTIENRWVELAHPFHIESRYMGYYTLVAVIMIETGAVYAGILIGQLALILKLDPRIQILNSVMSQVQVSTIVMIQI